MKDKDKIKELRKKKRKRTVQIVFYPFKNNTAYT